MAGQPKGKLPRGISLRGGKYRVRITYHGERYQVGEYHTLGDAKAALDIARSQVARDVFVPIPTRWQQRREEREARAATAVTAGTWADTWLKSLSKLGRSPGTIKAYTSTLNVHVLPMLRDKKLIDVGTDDVEAIIAGKSDSVKYNVTRTMSSMFKAAIAAKVGGLTESPVTSSYSKTRRADEDSHATLEQVAAIAAGMPERLRVAVWLAATVGLRLGEVLGLQRRDLELDADHGSLLHVRRQWLMKASPPRYSDPKSGSARKLAIPGSIVSMIRNHLDSITGPRPESPLLPSTIDALTPVSQTSFDRAWRTARKPVLPNLHFHDLRHVALTLYGQQGATNEELLRRGGHTSLEVAQIYQIAAAERDRQLTTMLDAKVRQALAGKDAG